MGFSEFIVYSVNLLLIVTFLGLIFQAN